MTTARSQQICLEQTPWYHCTTRCVRRAFICGYDALTNRDYSHRRQWIEDRLLLLSNVFCIDVGGYAVMSNHYHIVVKIDIDRALALTRKEVIERWLILYSGTPSTKKFINGELLTDEENQKVTTDVAKWRTELSNISRFMAQLNQNIARRANIEDGCKGKFWESRFDSQAILDVDALLRTLVYVDLNPVRAKITATPEDSKHTSLYRRLSLADSGLIPFSVESEAHLRPKINESVIPMLFDDYLTLLDWTGRELRSEKRGSIAANAPSIFERLKYSPKQWIRTLEPTKSWQQRALGSLNRIKQYCQALDRRWIWQATEHAIEP